MSAQAIRMGGRPRSGRGPQTHFVGLLLLLEGLLTLACSAMPESSTRALMRGSGRCVEVHASLEGVTPAVVSQLTLGLAHRCALMGDRSVRCAGLDVFGRLGTGERAWQFGPVTVPGLPPAAEVHDLSAIATTCVRTVSGEVWCWGANPGGQLGVPPESVEDCAIDAARYPCSRSPRRVLGVPRARRLLAGERRYCALDEARGVWCWGGEATRLSSTSPARTMVVDEGTDVALFRDEIVLVHTGNRVESAADLPAPRVGAEDSLHVGSGASVCVIESSRGARCRFARDSRVGTRHGDELRGPSCVRSLAAGDHHACAVLTDGRVSCWGINLAGETGAPAAVNHVDPAPGAPTLVQGLTRVVSVAVFGELSCAIRDDGSTWCWGRTGEGTTHVPVPVRW